ERSQLPGRAAAFAPLPVAALPLFARLLEAALGGFRAVVLPATARCERQRLAQAGGAQFDQLAQGVLRLRRINRVALVRAEVAVLVHVEFVQPRRSAVGTGQQPVQAI